HLRNMRVLLDPNDHGYAAERAAQRADVGELELDRSCDQTADGPPDHEYLSAGDTAGASGDRAYRGCYLCGRPRREHPEKRR
ncbi:MAG TPA: hypothetical protein VIV58_21980, partial [Kofleriaceae bacterium]